VQEKQAKLYKILGSFKISCWLQHKINIGGGATGQKPPLLDQGSVNHRLAHCWPGASNRSMGGRSFLGGGVGIGEYVHWYEGFLADDDVRGSSLAHFGMHVAPMSTGVGAGCGFGVGYGFGGERSRAPQGDML
jgi:hypothetical protein